MQAVRLCTADGVYSKASSQMHCSTLPAPRPATHRHRRRAYQDQVPLQQEGPAADAACPHLRDIPAVPAELPVATGQRAGQGVGGAARG